MVKLTLEGQNPKGKAWKTQTEIPDAIHYAYGPFEITGEIPLEKVVPAGIRKMWDKMSRGITDGIDKKKQKTAAEVVEYCNRKVAAFCGKGVIRSAKVGDPLARAFRALVEQHCKAVSIKIPKRLSGNVETMAASAKELGLTAKQIAKARVLAKERVAKDAKDVSALSA